MLLQCTIYNVVYVVKYNPQLLDISEMIFNCDLLFKFQISLALDSVEGVQISFPINFHRLQILIGDVKC